MNRGRRLGCPGRGWTRDDVGGNGEWKRRKKREGGREGGRQGGIKLNRGERREDTLRWTLGTVESRKVSTPIVRKDFRGLEFCFTRHRNAESRTAIMSGR